MTPPARAKAAERYILSVVFSNSTIAAPKGVQILLMQKDEFFIRKVFTEVPIFTFIELL